MHVFVTIIILLLMLGILISTHEAGHLLVAKRFGVYCDEYSIGFGPKIFSHKKKGGETTFSIRAIPLGGYVSMYGEGANDDQDDEEENKFASIPPERSLEGIAAWKKCLVLVAGITVNLVLSFLFCIIFAISFPNYQSYQSLSAINIDTSITSSYATSTYEGGTLRIGVNSSHPWLYGFYVEGDTSLLGEADQQSDYRLLSPGLAISEKQTEYGFIIDSDAVLKTGLGEKNDIVVLYYPTNERAGNDFYSCLSFYTASVALPDDDSIEKQLSVNHYPDFSVGKITISDGETITMNITLANINDEGHIVASSTKKSIEATYSSSSWSGPSLTTYSNEYWLPFGKRLLVGCLDWVNFFPLIGEGIKSIFMGNINNVGGIVAMGAGLSQLSSYMGWGKTFFYYGGLISLNLAIFNLLPFPGLDGWGLLVTIVEKGFKRKMPQKAKSVASIVGIGLLMLFAVFITIKDILQFLF